MYLLTRICSLLLTLSVVCATIVPPTPMGPIFPTVVSSDYSIPITLTCNANSAGQRIVSFGVPFPRGFLTNANMVRVENSGGQEVASDTMALLPWRHVNRTDIDGQSIRSVFVSFRHTCVASTNYAYVIHWGVAKTLTANTGITPSNVHTQWGPQVGPLATEHPATDNYNIDTSVTVTEPYVWVTLPAAWLMKCNIRGPVCPFSDSSFLSHVENFHKTVVNDVHLDVVNYASESASGLIDWNVEYEAWLFDRPFALWNVYIQTGSEKWLRHSHRASQYYAAKIALSDTTKPPYLRGSFTGKPSSYDEDPGDAKYSHVGGLFAAYLITGSEKLLEPIKAMVDFLPNQVQFTLPPIDHTSGLYTERHLTAGLNGIMYAYEIFGTTTLKQQLLTIINGMQKDVDSPPPGYPLASEMRGVLFHRPEVHEGSSYPDLMISAWMGSLLTDSLMHYYMLSDDQRSLSFMSNYAQFSAEKTLYYGAEVNQLVPWYTPGLRVGQTDSGEFDDVQHTPDIMGVLARGRWARKMLGLSTSVIDQQLPKLQRAAKFSFNDAIRETPGWPRYRATPVRRVTWWFSTNAGFKWFGMY